MNYDYILTRTQIGQGKEIKKQTKGEQHAEDNEIYFWFSSSAQQETGANKRNFLSAPSPPQQSGPNDYALLYLYIIHISLAATTRRHGVWMRPNGLAVQNSFPHTREKKKVEHDEENKRNKKRCE